MPTDDDDKLDDPLDNLLLRFRSALCFIWLTIAFMAMIWLAFLIHHKAIP